MSRQVWITQFNLDSDEWEFYCKLAQELHKSLQEIFELPASEIEYWHEYFHRYPFTQDREDMRTALICQTIANMSGKKVKKDLSISVFLPNFSGKSKPQPEKSVAQQQAEFSAFVSDLRNKQAQIKAMKVQTK